jgi:hypothetical protein
MKETPMQVKFLIAALALVATVPSAMAATCTASFALGSMAPPPQGYGVGNEWHQETGVTFNDCYTFTLGALGNIIGQTLELDGNKTDLEILTASLFKSTGEFVSSVDLASLGVIQQFEFDNLSAGDFRLELAGNATRSGDNGNGSPFGYTGTLSSNLSTAAPVPEPGTAAMLGLGLGVVAWVHRRQIRRG